VTILTVALVFVSVLVVIGIAVAYAVIRRQPSVVDLSLRHVHVEWPEDPSSGSAR
jgi:hypothetical protein